MTLFVNNDNNIELSRLRLQVDPDVEIEDASPLATLCEFNTLVIESISLAASAVVTFTTVHGFANGDRVLVTRVRGTESANGKHTISSVTEFGFTMTGIDTSGDEPYYPATGAIYLIVPGGAEVLDMIFDDDVGYYAVYDASLPLRANQKYVSFIEEEALDFEVEMQDTAKVRTR